MFSWLELWKCRELKKEHKRSVSKERGRERGRERDKKNDRGRGRGRAANVFMVGGLEVSGAKREDNKIIN